MYVLVVHMYMTALLKQLAGATGVFGQLVWGGGVLFALFRK